MWDREHEKIKKYSGILQGCPAETKRKDYRPLKSTEAVGALWVVCASASRYSRPSEIERRRTQYNYWTVTESLVQALVCTCLLLPSKISQEMFTKHWNFYGSTFYSRVKTDDPFVFMSSLWNKPGVISEINEWVLEWSGQKNKRTMKFFSHSTTLSGRNLVHGLLPSRSLTLNGLTVPGRRSRASLGLYMHSASEHNIFPPNVWNVNFQQISVFHEGINKSWFFVILSDCLRRIIREAWK